MKTKGRRHVTLPVRVVRKQDPNLPWGVVDGLCTSESNQFLNSTGSEANQSTNSFLTARCPLSVARWPI